MITIRFDGHKEYADMLRGSGKQAPFATSIALNDLAFKIREQEMKTISEVFDRPKPQTVRNVWVRKARKENLSATISFNQIYEGDEYMVTEIEGGQRKQKRSEKAFGRYYVPGAGAKLDKYGNMSGSQITQIMSQLGLHHEVGSLQNRTARSASRSRGAKKSTEYFLVTAPTGGLKPGVYQRVQSGAGFGGKTSRALPVGSYQKGKTSGRFSSVIRSRGVIPVMIFVNKPPTYRKRFPFYDVGQQVVDRHAGEALTKAIDYALRTAR